MSKEIIIFDVDGVLLEPHGYHQALKDTVRMGARELGFDVELSDEQVARFEGMGISSEWHSAAACLSLLAFNGDLALEPLFESLKRQPSQIPARIRLERVVTEITGDAQRIRESETIQSPSTQIFQEMILGSAGFEAIYGLESRLGVDSYLMTQDRPQLGADARKRLFAWLEHPERGCGIMTNRPSRRMPDAKYAQRLVGLDAVPVMGYGDMEWLAEKFGGEAAEYSKPSPIHALAAVLVSLGKEADEALIEARAATKGDVSNHVARLDGYRFTVFEDTPAGVVSVGTMADLLRGAGLDVEVQKIGITPSAVKAEFLRAQGAQVFDDVNSALMSVFCM